MDSEAPFTVFYPEDADKENELPDLSQSNASNARRDNRKNRPTKSEQAERKSWLINYMIRNTYFLNRKAHKFSQNMAEFEYSKLLKAYNVSMLR